ncbi:hypothetical protein AAFG13_12525 [Bradyrhizobium sp. B124]|uniref:hypothetical protein n=1 Tax=Bradyrhizobium sp. B124 TaxID=3140245 RepID=UPI0031834FCF
MNVRDTYGFDPEAYGAQGSGGLLDALNTMIGRDQRVGSTSDFDRPEYAPSTYAGSQSGLIGRLLDALQGQASYAPGTAVDRNPLVGRIVTAESSGNPNAVNRRSSASGVGQFINGTWVSMLRKHRPDLAIGKSDDELVALKSNPDLSREMIEAYAADNGRRLAKVGLPVTSGTTYLAHFAGPDGAISVLQADPSTPVSQLLSSDAMNSNPFLQGMTAGDLRAWADRKMQGKPARQPTAAPKPFPTSADPIFPRPPRAAPVPSPIGRRIGGMVPPISPADDAANAEEPAGRSLPGLASGLPMQYWPIPIFGTDR